MDLEEKIATLLAYVWRQFYAVWGKKIRGRNPLDVFQHRIKVAAYMPTFQRFLEKLAHGLGLQSLSVPRDIVEELKNNGDEVIELLREESVYLVVRAYNISKTLSSKQQVKLTKLLGGDRNEDS